MPIVIRPAHLESDRELLNAILKRFLTPLANGSRFNWLYRDNPFGQARVWLAIESDTGAVVGTASAFPRRLYAHGCEVSAWVLGDFCINDQYRSLGPALKLQRACLMEVNSGGAELCYDFPNMLMMAVYKRLGVGYTGQMLRLAKPLRVDRTVRKAIKIPLLAQGVTVAGNRVLALLDRQHKALGCWRFSLHQEECDDEFSALARKVGGRYGVCVQRSAEYLNWRYFANTYCQYELLTARYQGDLAAYVFFTQIGEDAIVGDLFGIAEPVVLARLVDELVDLLRGRGVVTISAPILWSHPWRPLLESRGFRVREASPIVIYGKQSSWEGLDWFLMYGDRDS
jgi:hypothetical protein